MSAKLTTYIAVFVGILLGAAGLSLITTLFDGEVQQTSEENKPLYWVAPMDANYRRDKPGKSPMGMDLIPVYEDNAPSTGLGSGVVTIAPHVVNNLGVRTAPVEMSTMHTIISTVGYIQYDENKLVHIHPRVDGWIEKLYVKAAGEPVKKGEAIYTLYSPQLVNAQEELLIALKRNNHSLIGAARERLRALQLSSNFIKSLEQSREVKQTVTFYAPQSGFVDGLQIREGFYVKPGNNLMSIGQLSSVWVEAEVFERDAALVQKGLPVSMTLDYLPGHEWKGVVDYVYPTLNAQTRTLRVRLAFDNDDMALKPNMFAQVAIHTRGTGQTMLVPKEAVIRTGKQDRVVLAAGEGQFKSIEVEIGRVDSRHVEILHGLQPEDIVVTSAQFLIDSESSKSSDFRRMAYEELLPSAWIKGAINHINDTGTVVTMSHDPVPEWQWPRMTMDFTLAKTLDVNALTLKKVQEFNIAKKKDGSYEILDFREANNVATAQFQSATVDGVINHIDSENRTLNITRAAIPKWQRDAATLDFLVDKNIALANLVAGTRISFTFEVREDLVVVALEVKQASHKIDSQSKVHDEHAQH